MAFWGIEIKPGKPYLHQYDDERGRLHLSQATLGSGSSKEKAVVVCNVGEKKPIYLCSLLPRKMETCSLNIEFEEYDEVTFSVEGPHSIHLSGFFYGEKPDSDGDDYESDSDEEGLGAEIDSKDDGDFEFDEEEDEDDDVLTDTEMDMFFDSKDDGDFEFDEEEDEDDDVLTDTEMDMFFDSKDDGDFEFDEEEDEDDDLLTDTEMDMFPSSNVPNSGVRIEEIVDDEKPVSENAIPDQKKKNKRVSDNDYSSQKQIVLKDSSGVLVLESEDEDGFPVSSSTKDKASVSSNEQNLEKSTGKNENGKAKRKEGTHHNEQTAKRKKDDTIIGNDSCSKQENVEATTPEADVKKAKKKKTKNKKVKENVEETIQDQTPKKVAPVGNKDSKKKNAMEEEKNKKEQASQVRTFPNGLVIEEIQMGEPNGKRADPGKKVSVRYAGKLKMNGKIFDSNIEKGPPFKFRLGVGQVIKGWDVGLKGMRVGDKRRLTIPPAMGYGAKGAGSVIPPNSWLVFDVELVAVG